MPPAPVFLGFQASVAFTHQPIGHRGSCGPNTSGEISQLLVGTSHNLRQPIHSFVPSTDICAKYVLGAGRESKMS